MELSFYRNNWEFPLHPESRLYENESTYENINQWFSNYIVPINEEILLQSLGPKNLHLNKHPSDFDEGVVQDMF